MSFNQYSEYNLTWLYIFRIMELVHSNERRTRNEKSRL